jgi:DnaK suppressor protein
MTAPFEVSRRAVRVAHPLLSALQAETLRALLLAELGERTHQLAREATRLAALATNPSKDPTGFDRAMSALRMYGARVAIEEIDAALVRVDASGSGTCQGCDGPIPFERLEAIPDAQFCRDVGSNRSENKRGVGAPARDPFALAESRARHPSSVHDAE